MERVPVRMPTAKRFPAALHTSDRVGTFKSAIVQFWKVCGREASIVARHFHKKGIASA